MHKLTPVLENIIYVRSETNNIISLQVLQSSYPNLYFEISGAAFNRYLAIAVSSLGFLTLLSVIDKLLSLSVAVVNYSIIFD